MSYTPTAVLSIRAMQDLMNKGWPNHGLQQSKKDLFVTIQTKFTQEMGRDMTIRDLEYVGQ